MFGVGQELELDEPVAYLLIQRGRAEEVKPPEKPQKKKRRSRLRNANR
jgi:hypothetical protein